MLRFLFLCQALASLSPDAASVPPAATAGPAAPQAHAVLLGTPDATPRGHEIRRARDGLFYVTAMVNGAPVRFLVDTGASVVVLTQDDARRAGVGVAEADLKNVADTAAGRTAMAKVTLDEVVVGHSHVKAIDAAVVGRGLPVSLLGQSWLSRIGSVTITGDRMLLD